MARNVIISQGFDKGLRPSPGEWPWVPPAAGGQNWFDNVCRVRRVDDERHSDA